MSIRFKFKTEHAFYIKILTELIQNCVETACFKIKNHGIEITAIDTNGQILIETVLNAERFLIYKYTQDMSVGLSISHLHKILKLVKNKDVVKFSIYDDDIKSLVIEIFPKEMSGRSKKSVIPIQEHHSDIIKGPDINGRPITIFSDQFQKVCREINQTKMVKIQMFKYKVRFCVDNLYKTSEEISVFDNNDLEDEIKNNKHIDIDEVISEATFNTSLLTKFMKLSRVSSKIYLYSVNECVIFKLLLGDLGTMQIFIKSNERSEMERNLQEESDSEE